MQTKNNDGFKTYIKDLIDVLLHKLWIIIIVGIIGSLTIVSINLYVIGSLYTSTTKIYLINRQNKIKTTSSDLATGNTLAQDFMILVTRGEVLEQVIKITKVDITPEELTGMIAVSNPQGTRILEISVTDYDAATAKKLADAIANISSEQLIRIMQIEKVNILEEGNLPSTPTGRNLFRSFLSGGVLGIVIASAIIILIQKMNENIKSPDDIEHYLGITTIGIIPLDEINQRKHKNKIKHKNKPESVALLS